MNRPILILLPDDLTLSIILELDPVVNLIRPVAEFGRIVRIRVDFGPQEVVAVYFRGNTTNVGAVDVRGDLVAGGGVFGSEKKRRVSRNLLD